ncbi:MAG: hypothetical protein IJ687_06035 [Bacteroidales bacterium]|nr:hypothetical protein [Bacteroidales bacterium]
MKRSCHIIFAFCFFAALVSSCFPNGKKKEGGDDSGSDIAVTVELKPLHGIRTAESVVSSANAVLTVLTGDESANYEAVYTVNGRAYSANNVWLGQQRSLSGSFADCTEFGKYIVKGVVTREDGTGGEVPFETEVWMRGISLDSHEAAVVSGKERTVFSDTPVEMFLGETGRFEYTYSPASDYLEFKAVSSSKGCIWLGEQSFDAKTRTYSVPFSADAAGEATVTLTLVNGNEEYTRTQKISCLSAGDRDYLFDVAVTVPSECVIGSDLPVRVSLLSGDDAVAYDIAVDVDGTRAAQSTGVFLAKPATVTVPVSFMARGSREVSVSVSRSDGKRTVTKTATVAVTGVPLQGIILTLTDPDGKAVTLSGTGVNTLVKGKDYTASLSFVPSDATVKGVSLEADGVMGNPSGMLVRGAERGEGTITVKVKGVIDYSFGFRCEAVRPTLFSAVYDKEEDILEMSFADPEMAGAMAKVEWSLTCHGSCDWTQCEGKDLETDPATLTYHRETSKKGESGSGIATLSASGTRARLQIPFKDYAKDIRKMSVVGSEWVFDSKAGSDSIFRQEPKEFFYDFVIDDFRATVSLAEEQLRWRPFTYAYDEHWNITIRTN